MTALQIIGIILLTPGVFFFMVLFVVSATSGSRNASSQKPCNSGSSKKKTNLHFIGGVPFYFDR